MPISDKMRERAARRYGLAVGIAKRYAATYGREHYDDFRGAAGLGLSRAAMTYNKGHPSVKGGTVKFVAYANRCIHTACVEYARSLAPKGYRYSSKRNRARRGDPSLTVPAVTPFSATTGALDQIGSAPKASKVDKLELVEECRRQRRHPSLVQQYEDNWVY